MTQRDDADSSWALIVGPVFTLESLERELGLSATEIERAVGARQLLRMDTAEGIGVFPSFQVSSGRVVDGLHQVLVVLERVFDSWTIAQFLNARAGCPPQRRIERLRAGEVDAVVSDAERAVANWLI